MGYDRLEEPVVSDAEKLKRSSWRNLGRRSSQSRGRDEKEPPIFPLGIRPGGKKEEISRRIATESVSEEGLAKGCLVKAQRQIYDEGRYKELAEKLKKCTTTDEYLEAFSDWPEIQNNLKRIRTHEQWIWKDTTWSWISPFYYVAPPSVISEKIPLLIAESTHVFDYHCELCAKGGYTTLEQHCETRAHLELQYRFVNVNGNTPIPECRPQYKPLVGKYLLDMDVKTLDPTDKHDPVDEADRPDGFASLHEPGQCPGYVVLIANLNSEASSVRVTSSAMKLGPKLEKDHGKKKTYYFDFFQWNEKPEHYPQKRKRKSDHFPVQTWRTLAFPVEKKGWVDVQVDGNVIHYEHLDPPESGTVLEITINDKTKRQWGQWERHSARHSANSNSTGGRRSGWGYSDWNAGYSKHDWRSESKNVWVTCPTERKEPLPLTDYLKDSYPEDRRPSDVMWPIQYVGSDNFLMAAVVYMADAPPRKTTNDWKNGWSQSWSSTNRGEWKSNNWSDKNDWKDDENTKDEATVSSDSKKDIVFYLHGDQYRERVNCNLPGIASFMWPKPDAGAIKFAREKGALHGKILIHPCCPDDSYWFRTPNVHDAKTYNKHVASALTGIRDIAARYWNGNPSRCFVTGISMGGYGALELAALWGPKIVAGMLVACPSHDAIRQEYFAKRLRDIRMWVFHGRRDHLCKWEETSSLMLRISDMEPRELRYSCTGCKDFESHTDTGYCLENKVAYDWLFEVDDKSW